MTNYYITTDYPSDLRLIQLSDQFNLIPWPNRENPVWSMQPHRVWPKNIYTLTARTDKEAFNEQLRLPIRGIIDSNAGNAAIKAFFENERQASLLPSLGLLITGQVLYSCDMALIFTRALAERLNFSSTYFDAIRMVIHESLVNALIHGNLRLSNSLRKDGQHFMEYARELSDRLHTPLFSQKSIRIRAQWTNVLLEIKIQDEGNGYCPAGQKRSSSELYAATGRGLKIIADVADACTISDHGREITLSFRRTNNRSFSNVSEKNTLVFHRPNFHSARVFVAKKNPLRVRLVTHLLNSIGIVHLKTGDTSRIKVNDILRFKPDLIILDVIKDNDSSLQLLRDLKGNMIANDIPVLAKIPANRTNIRRHVLVSGAVDYIEKPIIPAEFLIRVGVHLQNRLLVQKLKNQLNDIKKEQYSAQKMQIGMLPSPSFLNTLKEQYHIEIAHYFIPSSLLGGDFWQAFKISDTQLGFYLSDFSGHGMSAALNTFRLHTLMSAIQPELQTNPAGVLSFLNERLYDLLPRGQFTTFFYGIIDIKNQILTYSGAGAVPPILSHKNKKTYLKIRGIPLGIQTNSVYENQTHSFKTDDFLLLFSDAVTDGTASKPKHRLSYTNFIRLIQPAFQRVHKSSVRHFLDDIIKRFFGISPPPLSDDLTVICFKFMKDQ